MEDTTTIDIETGLGPEACTRVAEALHGVLADTWVLYARAHGYHWNVRGPHFVSLHALFKEQYKDLWKALDDLAERVRMLGADAPVGTRAMAADAELADDDEVPDATGMVRSLLDGHAAVLERARAACEVADEEDDVVTADLLTSRIAAHEKAAWMLRSFLDEG